MASRIRVIAACSTLMRSDWRNWCGRVRVAALLSPRIARVTPPSRHLCESMSVSTRTSPIAPTRSTITHSSFMSEASIAGAARLGIGVDLQPAWLYLDARTLVMQFGERIA